MKFVSYLWVLCLLVISVHKHKSGGLSAYGLQLHFLQHRDRGEAVGCYWVPLKWMFNPHGLKYWGKNIIFFH